MYNDNSDNIVDKYNNRYGSIIKIKLVDVKSSMCIDSSKETKNKDPKCKIGDTVRISKTFFAKGYLPNWSEEVFCN